MMRFSLLFFCVSVVFLSCQEEEVVPVCTPYEPPSGLDTYMYPLRPGMPEWAEIQTGAEMYEVTQVPDSVLQVISTEGLLETWLTYPLLGNIIAWSTLQQGIDNITETFGGLQELGRRPDAGSVMLNRYKQMNLYCIDQFTSDIEIGGFAMTFAFYEAILSQQVFLTKLSEAEQDELLDVALRNYAIKDAYSDEVYFIFDLKTSAVIAARLMQLADYAPFTKAMAQDDYLRVFVEQIELQGQVESIATTIHYANTFNQQRK